MRMFTLLKGANASINGVTYRTGDVVASNSELKALWPTRFAESPASATPTKWDVRVNDVVGMADYAVIGNANGVAFRIVDKKGKLVEGCGSMLLAEAFKKYFELMKIDTAPTKKEVKSPEVPKKTLPDDEDDEEKGKKNAPPSDDDDDEDDGKGKGSDEDDEDDDEKPAKKSKKTSDDDDDEEDAPKKKSKKASDDEDDEEDERPKKKSKK